MLEHSQDVFGAGALPLSVAERTELDLEALF